MWQQNALIGAVIFIILAVIDVAVTLIDNAIYRRRR